MPDDDDPRKKKLAIHQGPADDTRSIAPFASEANFVAAQRVAKALGSSSLVPKQYQGHENLPNVLIALELASRIGASPLMVMQNLYVVQGKPSWSSSFLIACVNQSSRFTPLRFKFEGKPGADDWGCRAEAKDKDSGEVCTGALITIKLAKAEGWYGKSGSKWQTMPEQMLMYRAAGFWSRVYAPELSLGMLTAEEQQDIPAIAEKVIRPLGLDAEILGAAPAATVATEPPTEKLDEAGGEIPTDKSEPVSAENTALDINDAIDEADSVKALQLVGVKLNDAKALIGEVRHKALLEKYQGVFRDLEAKEKVKK